MTWDRYDKLEQVLLDDVRAMGQAKAADYAADDDRLANFKRLAADLTSAERPIEPTDVLWIYLRKHLDAIRTYIAHRGENEQSEPIRGRIVDAIAYLALLHGLVVEHEGGEGRVQSLQSEAENHCGQFQSRVARNASGYPSAHEGGS